MPKKWHHKTVPRDRVPVRQKIGCGFGAMSQVLGSYSIRNLAGFVLNIGLGVSLAVPEGARATIDLSVLGGGTFERGAGRWVFVVEKREAGGNHRVSKVGTV